MAKYLLVRLVSISVWNWARMVTSSIWFSFRSNLRWNCSMEEPSSLNKQNSEVISLYSIQCIQIMHLALDFEARSVR